MDELSPGLFSADANRKGGRAGAAGTILGKRLLDHAILETVKRQDDQSATDLQHLKGILQGNAQAIHLVIDCNSQGLKGFLARIFISSRLCGHALLDEFCQFQCCLNGLLFSCCRSCFGTTPQSFVLFDMIEIKRMPCKKVLEACALCGCFWFSLADEGVIFHRMMAV